MWTLARMPGNRFVIPRSTRTGPSTMGGDSMPETTGGGPRAARLSVLRQLSRRLDARRRLDLSGDDLLPQDCDLRQHLLLQLAGEARTELAQGDPVVLQVEDDVRSALELPGLRGLDHVEDPD